jgi:hypothetical protein
MPTLSALELLNFIITHFAKFPPASPEPLLLSYPTDAFAPPAAFAKLVEYGYLRTDFGGSATYAQLDYRATEKTLRLSRARRLRLDRERAAAA